MLEANAAVDLLNSDGFTPLYAASETGKGECVELLIEVRTSLPGPACVPACVPA